MNLSLRIKMIISIILVAGLGLTIYTIYDKGPEEVITDEAIGEIQFKLLDESQSLVVDDRLSIYEEDTLYTLLQRNYDITCANRMYQEDDTCEYKFIFGYALLGIEDVKTNWYDSYLSISVNSELAVVGVSGIMPLDGDLIEIKVITSE